MVPAMSHAAAGPRRRVRCLLGGLAKWDCDIAHGMTNQITTALTALKKSKFRSRFKLSDKDRQYIQARGIDTIRSHAVDFIITRLAPAFPKNDGKQTPMRGHPVFIAQHATATCCRGCLWKWHPFEKGRPMNEDEIGFVAELVKGWIGGQMGGLDWNR